MRTGLVFSTAAHVTFLALAIFGLSFGEPMTPEAVDSIAVDLVPIEEFSNIRRGSLESDVVETDTPSATESDQPAELAQPTGNTEQDQPTPAEAPTPSPRPTTNTAPQDQPEPEPDPMPQSAAPPPSPVEPAPARPQPAPEPTPAPEPEPTPEPTPATETPELTSPTETAEPTPAAPAPVQRTASLDQKRAEFKRQQEAKQKAEADAKKKAEEEEKRKAEAERKRVADAKAAEEAERVADEERRRQQQASRAADQLNDILNNETSRGGTTGQGGSPTLGRQDGQAARLSNSQMAALSSQIFACLVSPAGIENSGLNIPVQFSVDAEGRPVGTPRPVNATAPGLEQSYASAAVRAIMRCGPYPMVAGQEVVVHFNPGQ